MNENNLSLGSGEPNVLMLKVKDCEIKPCAEVKDGVVATGFLLKMSRYHLDNILAQMIDDYGEKTLIQRIKNL